MGRKRDLRKRQEEYDWLECADDVWDDYEQPLPVKDNWGNEFCNAWVGCPGPAPLATHLVDRRTGESWPLQAPRDKDDQTLSGVVNPDWWPWRGQKLALTCEAPGGPDGWLISSRKWVEVPESSAELLFVVGATMLAFLAWIRRGRK
jgi:hypothetical protein